MALSHTPSDVEAVGAGDVIDWSALPSSASTMGSPQLASDTVVPWNAASCSRTSGVAASAPLATVSCNPNSALRKRT